MRAARLVTAVCAALALLALTPAAHAYRIGGKAWPGGTVTFYDATRNGYAVDTATQAWNRSGVRIRFREVRSRARADVVVVTLRNGGCNGFGQLGYAAGVQARVQLGAGCGNAWALASTAVHEFGHILGLNHEPRRCAVMNAVNFNGAPQECKPPGAERYRCRLLERDDVRGAVRMYGGRPKVRRRANCTIFGPPAPPAVTIAEAREFYGAFGASATVTAPQAPRPAARVPTGGIVRTLRTGARAGTCGSAPLPPADPRRGEAAIGFGERQTVSIDELAPGANCVVMWLVDGLGRTSPPTATDVTIAAEPLTAAFRPGCCEALAGFPMSFPLDVSVPDATFAWDFGDPASGAANASADPYAEHTYAQPGTYTVLVRVTDRYGRIADVSAPVAVTAP